MQIKHTHCDIKNVYIIKVPIGQRQRVHREGKCNSEEISAPRAGGGRERYCRVGKTCM